MSEQKTAGDQGEVTDPVCGMQVDSATSAHRSQHGGATYHFCSARCRKKFIAAPEFYLSEAPPVVTAAMPAVVTAAKPGAIYTCPMHPEIRQEGPGSCPICGMALEPLEVTADAGPNAELADMTRRFWIGLALSVPVVALAPASSLSEWGIWSFGRRRSRLGWLRSLARRRAV